MGKSIFAKIKDKIFGQIIGETRVVPLTTKLVTVFVIFILVSNFASNYLNLMFNRTEMVKMMKDLLVKDLKDLYSFCNSQYELYELDKNNEPRIRDGVINKAVSEFRNERSIFLCIKKNGNLWAEGSKINKYGNFHHDKMLAGMIDDLKQEKFDGALSFEWNNEMYFGVYKYHNKWDMFLLRAEALPEFYADSQRIFINTSIVILIMTLLSAVVGIVVLRRVTYYISIITEAIMKMIQEQHLEEIDLDGASNDNITYLGLAFNSLSNTINNLLVIFKKFVNQDIADQAYREREVRLEGSQKELAILFSDIKSFTFITEMLGTDIIKLLNMHYDRAIRRVIEYNGVIGSIIGDALLAVYGVMEKEGANKSFDAIMSAYKIQEVAEHLRMEMYKRREELVKKRGNLSELEEKVYKAVLIEVGCGVDGGLVFYGNIGSYARMTNTVIGDNVNSASRLEGLTRVYKVPVICSEFIKNDVQENVEGHGMTFVELDKVQVKGKTIGRKVYWPIPDERFDEEMQEEVELFQKGLKDYYAGDWEKAYESFNKCSLALSDVFKERTGSGNKAPDDWDGIWKMTTK